VEETKDNRIEAEVMINTWNAQTIDNLNVVGATDTKMQVEDNIQPENECVLEKTQGNGKEAMKMKTVENEETNNMVSRTPQMERPIKPQHSDRVRNDEEAGAERMTTLPTTTD
jgi:hypothetical protein